jgi:hypothetical protein
MSQVSTDEAREERITMEIIVDAYGPEEQALGWYYYLEEKLQFPFTARCIVERATSPLRVGDEVEVLGMASEEVCEHEMFVMARWGQDRTLAVPLAQLIGVNVDEETEQAIGDWHYWIARGYEL